MQPLKIGAFIIEESDIYLIVFSFVIGAIFLLLQPLIRWLVRLESVKLLCYMFCSLFVLTLFFLTVLLVEDLQDLAVPLLKILLQGLACFGVALFILYSVYYLLKVKRKQKRV